jgi:hypothetical protein
MNNILEDKIREHAEEIFGREPTQGHRDRFAGKLNPTGIKIRITIPQIISYAAVAAVFAFALYQTFKTEVIQESEPVAEVQNYYSMLLRDKIEAIEQLLPQVDEEDRASLMEDIENLQKEADFSMENSNENNTAFVVMTYSSKIEALQHIRQILETNL